MSVILFENRAPGARSRLRAALLGSCCTGALALAAGAASAQTLAACATPVVGTGKSCTVEAGADVSGVRILYSDPDAAGGGQQDAPDGTGYTVYNHATLDGPAASDQYAGIALRLQGGRGADDKGDAGDSGAGGDLRVENYGNVTVTDLVFSAHGGDDSAVGLWDRSNIIYGIYAPSVGGEGRDARAQDIGGGNGGHGGAGGVATLLNEGRILVGAGNGGGAERAGAVGILLSSTGGSGGLRDTTDGEPKSGSGGDAKNVGLSNYRRIDVCGSTVDGCGMGDEALSVTAAGLYLESLGGYGAQPTSSGGNGGSISIKNLARITVEALVERSGGAWGIHAVSGSGYAGLDSKSIGEPGGHGGDAKAITITHAGAIRLRAGDFDAPEGTTVQRACLETDDPACTSVDVPDFAHQSAGILAASYGSAAGASHDGTSDQNGGKGGDASANFNSTGLASSSISLRKNASVDVAGDNVIGVGLFAQGGAGGLGNSTDSQGGDGGSVGALSATLKTGARISTSGENAVGLILHAKGGDGGGVRSPGGLADFNDDDAGEGGSTAGVTLHLPNVSDGPAPTITTEGDRAVGVVLQSLAGGGGPGLAEYTFIDIGETKGGKGGVAGAVDVVGGAAISTDGRGSHGMLMQSISGGGGALTSDGDFIAVAGGGGGEGGVGGLVQFFNYGSRIHTRGDVSAGVVAQSIGGGGGDVMGDGGALSVITVGGQGGPGGDGGEVTLTYDSASSTITEGDFSFGVLAQSIGGGGGNGGDVFNIDARLPTVAIGGAGANGGAGGLVHFLGEPDGKGGRHLIATSGANAHALLLQSIGGGGGTGGDAQSLSFGLGSLSAISIAGGAGGGGHGGQVEATLEDMDIVTEGSHARGIVVHSIGGGGGAGGAATSRNVSFGVATSVSLGGVGGNGGPGGTVTLDLTNTTVSTGGDTLQDLEDGEGFVANNHGIVVQSIGSGGGMGGSGNALAYAMELPVEEMDANLAVAGAAAVGGMGGPGGDGGEIAISLTDSVVTTRGDGAHGILAHSVGGSGGDGGDATSMSVAALLVEYAKSLVEKLEPGDDPDPTPPGGEETGPTDIDTSVSVALGGAGAGSGVGGTVTVALDGASMIETFGPSSYAILAQSVANGGGNAGVGGAGAKQFHEGDGMMTNIGIGASAANAARAGGALSVSLGGDTVLRTHGENSRGVVLHSVGAGGGASSASFVGMPGELADAVAQKLAGIKAPWINIGIGMTGGAGGKGGDIEALDLSGGIETFGADADGVLAQTIGGGGGVGGGYGGDDGEDEDDDRPLLDFALDLQELKEQIARPWSATILVGGKGGSGGDGGDYAVASTETAAFRMPTLDGAIVTHGDYADGVVLQSIGGGGGAGGAAVPEDTLGILDFSLRLGGDGGKGGQGGSVGFRLGADAQVGTEGFGAHGVVLQSIGGGGGMGGSGSRLIAKLNLDDGSESGEVPGFVKQDLDELFGDGEAPLPAAVLRLGLGASGGGGDGAKAGRAEANGEGGLIQTTGTAAFGLAVQSIGGGGGMGGVGTAPLTAAEVELEHIDPDDRQLFIDNLNALFRGAHLDFIAGGDGGKGGNGGDALAAGAFTILTSGDRAPALLVQSVGGGGGAAGIEGARLLRHGAQGSIGDSGYATARLGAGTAINTTGVASHGAIVQSVAGGGGLTTATMAYGTALRRYDPDSPPASLLDEIFELRLGADDLSWGTAKSGVATLQLDDDITTRGAGAYAAIVQSVAGGGGVVSLTPAEIDRARTTTLSSGEVVMGTTVDCSDQKACAGAEHVSVAVSETAYITTLGVGSRGIVAQSVQSGGGVATGFEELQRPSAGEATQVTRMLSVVGSSAFRGPIPGASTLTFDGDVQTLGADADALVLQVIGGGGGIMGAAGGASSTFDENNKRHDAEPITVAADSANYRMGISLGQTNPAGGPQNQSLNADLGGWAHTFGDHAEAVIVQSISAGGGIAGLYQDPTSDSQAAASIRVGADGVDSGGDPQRQRDYGLNEAAAAGRLTAKLDAATYRTEGWGANGVLLQQIQGGGGVAATGAHTVRLVSGTTSDGWERVGLTVGGDYGGSFGSGELHLSAIGGAGVRTLGQGATAVLAQNVVGGGGVGATGTSQPLARSAAEGVVEARLGGSNTTDGPGGGGTGLVDVDIEDASFATSGDASHALLVQAVGGGGGLALAPSSWLTKATLGTSGGGTSVAGEIDARIGVADGGADGGATLLQTRGTGSRAATVQAISGGGGVLAAPSIGANWITDHVPVQLGADGGTSGKGGTITARFGARAITQGDYADGLLVQSIGGGGGVADIADDAGAAPNLALTLGQTAGGGRPNQVRLRLSGKGLDRGGIDTAGDGAYGVLQQAIGGGGGLASFAGRSALVEMTLGASSTGGGKGADIASMRMDAGSYFPYTGTTLSHVMTRGDDAHAVVLQSIGGGGGVARAAALRDGGEAHLALGGRGGDADGARAHMVYASEFATTGDRALGLVVQSIGGGGGIAVAGEAEDVASIRLGGADGFTGQTDADQAILYLYPNPTNPCPGRPCHVTFGEGAHGLVVQSIGGGGGIAGDVSLADGLTLIDYDAADAQGLEKTWGGTQGVGASELVALAVGVDVVTLGDGAYGLIAQSIAGGGGLAGGKDGAFAGKTGVTNAANVAGPIIIDVGQTGSVVASGRNSVAVFAQALGDDLSAQDIEVSIEGDVMGGTGEFGLGLLVHGGNASNLLTISDTGTLGSLEGQAVRYVGATNDGQSRLTIDNAGLLSGSVEAIYRDGEVYLNQGGGASAEIAARTAPVATGRLSRPAARLINRRGGVATGARVYQADVVNRGLLVAGDAGRFAPLSIAGHLVQGDRGTLAVDANPMTGKGDVIRVAGDARLDGELQVAARALALGAEHQVIEVQGDISGAFDRVAGALFRFEQVVGNGTLGVRATGIEIDEAPGVTGQEAAAARYLERLFMTGDDSYARFFGRLEAAAAGGALIPALSGMTLGASMAGEAATFELARDRFDALLDCGGTGGRTVALGDACLTMLGSGRDLSQDGNGAAGYDGQTWTLGFAGQIEVAPGWLVSGTVGWETLNLAQQGGGSSVDGTTGFVGAGVTREMGPLALSAAATAGWSAFDTTRAQGLLARGAADAEHDALSLGARLRAAWTQELDGGWLRPSLDLDLIHVAAEGYTENGAGRSALRVEDSDAAALVLTPSIEAGLRRDLGEDLGLRAWGRVGVSLSTLDSYDATARFAGDTTGAPGFVNGVAQSQAVGRIGLGASLQAGERIDVGVSYEGAFADGYTGHAGRIGVAIRF
ncbi:autotransporter outer membrane beta-barrel domain-containing protein [Albimonas pacifica]|uniref:Autotransporter domain-containing protein n=1 Tax=Albimonas pacifica TaxID=1114924 RepID=A0A1I3BJ93_9RHOB|nr:autotransporter outer membrane beta-barrel domain-containing protein [Albimonas pacifica]SFH62394.1 hypothetical protein SAMN05216258_101134 [Albimonas pacifica]